MYNCIQLEAILDNFIICQFINQYLTFMVLLHLDKHIEEECKLNTIKVAF